MITIALCVAGVLYVIGQTIIIASNLKNKRFMKQTLQTVGIALALMTLAYALAYVTYFN